MNFDQDNSIENFLEDDEPELWDKGYHFKERVNGLMLRYNMTREHAEGNVENVIRTKQTKKRCACGDVADFVVTDTKEIVCGKCRKARNIPIERCI